jgi:hypothetical protein
MSQMNRMERRERRRKRKELKRQRYLEMGFAPRKQRSCKKMNRHHLINKCQGGTWDLHNILWIYINKHQVWHSLFKNLDLDQVIALLQRVKLAKENQLVEHPR